MMAERWWDGKLNWFLNSLLLCFVSPVEQSSDITEMAAEEKGEKPKYEVEEISIKTRVQKILDLSTSRCINSPFNIVWTKGSQNGWHFGKASSFGLVLAICFDFFDKRLAFTFLTYMIKYSHVDKKGKKWFRNDPFPKNHPCRKCKASSRPSYDFEKQLTWGTINL